MKKREAVGDSVAQSRSYEGCARVGVELGGARDAKGEARARELTRGALKVTGWHRRAR